MRHAFLPAAICALVLTFGTAPRAQVSFSVTIGPPPPPRVFIVPAQPGPDFVWVEGYWYPQGRRYRWHDGYWTRAPFPDAYWVQPYYYGGRYYGGYWENDRGWLTHNHRWDRDHDRRDYRRGKPRRDRDDRR